MDEILSEEDLQLRRMLKNLESVDAPNDFEFRLKNRIANAQPNIDKPRFVWAFRFALPVLAVGIMFAAFFVLSGNFWSNGDSVQVPPVPEIMNSSFTANKTEIVETSPMNLNEEKITDSNQKTVEIPKNEVAQNNSKPQKIEKSPLNKPEMPIGSKDFGFNQEKPLQPIFNSNVNLRMPENNSSISAQNLLSQIGVSVAAENGKLVVKSLTSNGLGKSSGIREGDVIEAIDNQKISPATVFKNSVVAKTIVVLRNNIRQTIILKN